MLIHSIKLQNLLSFGPNAEEIPLGPLNILIGPNGSGKSNFLEAIQLLQSIPNGLGKGIRQAGGLYDFLWKGSETIPEASLDVIVQGKNETVKLRYSLAFTNIDNRLHLIDEKIENEKPNTPTQKMPYFYYHLDNGKPVLNTKDTKVKKRSLMKEEIDLNESILSQRYDPEQYPEVSYLSDRFKKINHYNSWFFGRDNPLRRPQKLDMPSDFLLSNYENLAVVLNRFRREPKVKKKFLEALHNLYHDIEDFDVKIEGGTGQIFLQEEQRIISTTRLSDGTLRYLCLLAILCHPNPPPLICIEEPELGLHPDLISTLANLLKEASERCQLIVTTHSEMLVDAMTETPEAILVCEREKDGTHLRRLEPEQLKTWLEEYRLGSLWMSGELGGVRW